MNRKWMFLFFACIMLLSLSACGKAVKNEDSIKDDVLMNDEAFENNPTLSIISFHIQSRQTNKDLMRDSVWVLYTAENDVMHYNGKAELVYELFNEGWKLKEFTNENAEYSPSQPCDKSVVEKEFNLRNYIRYEYISERKISETEYHYYYKTVEPYKKYFDCESDKTIICKFWNVGEWDVLIPSGENRHYLPNENLLGVWTYSKKWNTIYGEREDNVTIDITSVSGNKIEAVFDVYNIVYGVRVNDIIECKGKRTIEANFEQGQYSHVNGHLYSIDIVLSTGQTIVLHFKIDDEIFYVSYDSRLYSMLDSFKLTKQ